MKRILSGSFLTVLLSAAMLAQDSSTTPLHPVSPAPAQPPASDQDAAPRQMNQNAGQNDQMPVFRVNVYARTTKAVNYRHRGGSTTVDLRGTDLMPQVGGHAKIDGKVGRLAINAELTHLVPASTFGGQYLTYVLWAITPEGRAVNLGEVLPGENGKDKIDVTTDLQAFGLIVTAEPYYSVTHPSNKVVAENILRQETKGFEEPIDAKFDVLEGAQYTIDVPAEQLPSTQADARVPLDLLEARNAVAIAKAAGARQYAADSLAKAEDMLQRAEDYYQRKQGRTPIGTAARGATQMAEDARVLTLRRIEKEHLDAERRAHQEAQEKAEADARAAQDRAAQAQAQSDEDARRRAEAELAQAEAQRQQATALAQQQQAQADADAARLAAEGAARQTQEAERQRQEAIRQKEEMRARLLAQLNQVLQTRDTARGLIVSMPDVLFDFNKYTLKPEARERLARISGIVLAYPDLKLQVEGYTDAIGSDEYNQTLSEKRAEAVRDYLVSSGVSMNNVAAQGMGKADPVADNSTAAGRKLNRRVEMIVSGDVIGTQLTPGAPGDNAQGPQNPQ
ncbi:MAG TPA: OmpA family protein [Candidatus Acidoferrum sp.]|jgi:outer membrane protein OmpA-like peptidoglycan-associated protein|nr:OmpA family protein [Candidatus Acidoferrum sp.]